jgi:hypothetical protein
MESYCAGPAEPGPRTAAPESLALRDASLERSGERLANGLELDAVEDVLEEATHDQSLGFSP